MILLNPLHQGQLCAPAAELLGESGGISDENQVDIRHPEIGFQQGVDDQRAELIDKAEAGTGAAPGGSAAFAAGCIRSGRDNRQTGSAP